MVDLPSPYHALFGRPALAQFMASTHVAYLKMKMPGPNGTITVAGDYRVSMQCASAGSALAESMVIAEEMKKMQFTISFISSAITIDSARAEPMVIAEEMKKMQFIISLA